MQLEHASYKIKQKNPSSAVFVKWEICYRKTALYQAVNMLISVTKIRHFNMGVYLAFGSSLLLSFEKHQFFSVLASFLAPAVAAWLESTFSLL